jgi:hypothetical protein
VCCVELMTASHNVQFNPMLAGSIILAYVLIGKKNDFLATLLIAIGLLIKLYGVVGIMFIIFSSNKKWFLVYFLFWMTILFCLPMLISSPAFIFQTYGDWFKALIDKNTLNIQLDAYGTDISVMGFIRRVFSLTNMSNLTVLIPAFILILLPVLRRSLHHNIKFQLYYLSLALISVVIFSSSSESPTYIIAVAGVSIWYTFDMEYSRLLTVTLLTLVIVLTSFSTTDLFPSYIKTHWMKPFSLKVLPCLLVWLLLIYQLSFSKKEFIAKIN